MFAESTLGQDGTPMERRQSSLLLVPAFMLSHDEHKMPSRQSMPLNFELITASVASL